MEEEVSVPRVCSAEMVVIPASRHASKRPHGDFVGGFGEDFTYGVVDQIFGKEQAEGRFGGHFDLFDASGFHLAPRALGDGLA